MKKVNDSLKTDYFLDITDEVCPMTFVKTKLLLERVEAGSIVEIRLKGDEPLTNVPASVKEIGHEVLECSPECAEDPDGAHKLLIRRT